MGLHINAMKVKVMPMTKMYGPYLQVNISSTEVDTVQRFVYLGSELEARGTCDTEMRCRMVIAGKVMNRLSKSVFKRHDVTLNLNVIT